MSPCSSEPLPTVVGTVVGGDSGYQEESGGSPKPNAAPPEDDKPPSSDDDEVPEPAPATAAQQRGGEGSEQLDGSIDSRSGGMDAQEGGDASEGDGYLCAKVTGSGGNRAPEFDSTGASTKRPSAIANKSLSTETMRPTDPKQKELSAYFNPSSSLLPRSYRRDVAQTDQQFKLAAIIGTITWLLLLSATYTFAPPVAFERLDGIEQNAAIVAFVVLLVSNLSRVVPLVYRSRDRAISGVIWGSIAVQTIAMATNALMAFLPTPILVDPITRGRVHLVRWCEWTPVAGVMTFMTEGVDLPHSKHGNKVRVAHTLAQSVSTFGGFLFPLCPNSHVWGFTLLFSCLLYSTIFFRLRDKWKALEGTKSGQTVDDQEVYDRVRLSFRLHATCTFMWTLLVILYFVGWGAPLVLMPESVWNSPALPMVMETFCEIWSKVLYLLIIIEVHSAVFDEGARAKRRLAELRRMMGAVWESSSDVIAISVRSAQDGVVTTMISPTYMKLERALTGRGTDRSNGGGGDQDEVDACPPLVFELSEEDFLTARAAAKGGRRPDVRPTCAHYIDLKWISSASTPAHRRIRIAEKAAVPAAHRPSITALSELLLMVWNEDQEADGHKERLIMHDFHAGSTRFSEVSGRGASGSSVAGDGTSARIIRCEAKVTRLEPHALLVVVRDISDRFRIFEAEKRVVVEQTAREKDAEANRFTRHEVKNGLLAAIGLCDSLRETFGDEDEDEDQRQAALVAPAGPQETEADRSSAAVALLSSASSTWQRRLRDTTGNSVDFDVRMCMSELDSTLREVLDTIMAQSMVRDVVHAVYQPNAERVDIPKVLHGVRGCQLGNKQNARFPLITYPAPLPQFMFDPQLLRFIHRNAVSNAIKYGRKGGLVLTEVHFDDNKSELQMDVINLPGDHHQELMRMGSKAEDDVFAPNTRLHTRKTMNLTPGERATPFNDYSDTNYSSGDGAWIMRKCADTLGGICRIRFETERTVFSLRCPAQPVNARRRKSLSDPDQFRVPANTWGIAIDDSKIQRKLMGRMFSLLGISKSRIVELGKDADEIMGFDDTVVRTIRDYPNDYVLVIADENLDVVADEAHHTTISGSKCIQRIREQLTASEEQLLLALVRSANDSTDELAVYSSRAHGFLPKAPIQRDKVLEHIAPVWTRRFNNVMSCAPQLELPEEGSASGLDNAATATAFVTSIAEQDLHPDEHGNEIAVSSADLMQTVEVIDALCTQGDPLSLPERWPVIWEKLHVLKGDIKSLKESMQVLAVLEEINRLQGTEFPENFQQRWMLIRSLVVSIT